MTKTRNQLNLYAALDIVRGARRQLEVGECFGNYIHEYSSSN